MDGSGSDRVRKNVRYWLARIRTEMMGGAPAEGCPSGLRLRFETMPLFQVAGGWAGYRVSWDVGPLGQDMIGLNESQWESWHKVCMANAKELPVQKPQKAKRVERPDFDDHQEVTVQLQGD